MKLDPVTQALIEKYGLTEDGYEPGSILHKMSKLGIGEEPLRNKVPIDKNDDWLTKGISKLWGYVDRDTQNKVMSFITKTGATDNMSAMDKILLFAYKHNLINLHMKDGHEKANLTSGGVLAVAAAGLVTMFILYIGNKLYKIFFDKAEKLCSKYKGEEKDKCIEAYKGRALIESNKALMKYIKICEKSKDKKKCQEEIQAKIRKNQEKIRNIAQKSRKKIGEDVEFDKMAARTTPGNRSTVVSGSPAELAAKRQAFEKQRAQWNKGKK